MAIYKKGGFRRLNQMNGDFLAQLKEPLRSEVNRNVVGTNKATVAIMNKQLDLYFKEKSINVEKIRRSQEIVYGTMLRVHREKKILQRTLHKKDQEDTRHKFTKIRRKVSTHDEADVLKVEDSPQGKDATTNDVDPRKEPGSSKNTNSEQSVKRKKKPKTGTTDIVAEKKESDDPNETSLSSPRKSFEKRSKVLEVSKRAPLAPIVRERSNLTSENVHSTAVDTENDTAAKQTSRTSDSKNVLYLPPLPEKQHAREASVSDIAIATVAEAQIKSNDLPSANYRLEKISGVTQTSPSPKRMSKSSMAMPTISEKDSLRDIPTRHSDESIQGNIRKRKTHCDPNSQDALRVIRKAFDDEKAKAQSNTPRTPTARAEVSAVENEERKEGGSEMESKQNIESMVQHNRKRARERLRKRHKILQKEPFTVYVKSTKGTYVPTLTPFRRKEFAPPSQREQYFQEKMLRAQVDARLEQRQKLETFFERIAEEEREKERIREAFKKAMADEAEDARRQQLENEQKLGFSSSQMATLYSKGILPEGVDPNSFEAIKYCKYIRSSSPNSLAAAKKNTDRLNQSSWNKN